MYSSYSNIVGGFIISWVGHSLVVPPHEYDDG